MNMPTHSLVTASHGERQERKQESEFTQFYCCLSSGVI